MMHIDPQDRDDIQFLLRQSDFYGRISEAAFMRRCVRKFRKF